MAVAYGPGRYGANAEELLRKFGGKLCVVILIGGADGHAFDIATSDINLLPTLPEILRRLADDMEQEDLKG